MVHPSQGEPVIINGTITGDGATVATTTPVRHAIRNSRGRATFSLETRFRNLGSAGLLLIGVGSEVLPVGPGDEVVLTGHINVFTVQASTGTVAWTAIVAAA